MKERKKKKHAKKQKAAASWNKEPASVAIFFLLKPFLSGWEGTQNVVHYRTRHSKKMFKFLFGRVRGKEKQEWGMLTPGTAYFLYSGKEKYYHETLRVCFSLFICN